MEAPDKIYVDKFGQSINGYIPEGCSLVTEYIRKDALLEWLDGKLTIEGATEGYVGGYDSALKDVINKLNSI